MSVSFGIRKTITDLISVSLGNNELKDLGSIVRVRYCIPVLDFYSSEKAL